MSFDPQPHLIQLPKRVKDPETNQWVTRYDDYLEVKWRLCWFRDRYPHGRIETEEVCVDLDRVISLEVTETIEGKRQKVTKTGTGYARFKARVEDGEGGIATGYGTENAAEFTDFAERAETRALGRALAALGIGTQFVGAELSEGDHVVDSPVVRAENPADTSAAAEKVRPSVPVNGNGHTPALEQPKGAPKNLVQKSDLLHQIQDEITRLGRPVSEVTALYQAAFGQEITSWDLVCGESLHTLKHGLTYLKTLFQTEAPDEPQAPSEPAPEPQPSAAEGLQDPEPEAGAKVYGAAPAPTPEPEDTVESLVAYALSLGLEEGVTRRVIKLHKDLKRCRQIFTEAAERNRRQVA